MGIEELTEACDYKPEPSAKNQNNLLTASNLTNLGTASTLNSLNEESDVGTVFTARTYDSFFTCTSSAATRGTSCITYNTHYQERKNDDRRGIFTDPQMIPRAQEAR